MKYWSYLAAKLALATGLALWLHHVVQYSFPIPPKNRYGFRPSLFLQDMNFTFAILAVWMVATGLFALVIWDQRRRCRTCLRRLRMPISLGSWSNMLIFGRPQTAWICPYGHGTLKRDDVQLDVQLAAFSQTSWEPHGDDIWKELESYSSTEK
jgi:hypothetical protein